MSEYPIENVKFSINFRYYIPHEENWARFDAKNENTNLNLVVHSDKQKINSNGSIVLLMTFSDASTWMLGIWI